MLGELIGERQVGIGVGQGDPVTLRDRRRQARIADRVAAVQAQLVARRVGLLDQQHGVEEKRCAAPLGTLVRVAPAQEAGGEEQLTLAAVLDQGVLDEDLPAALEKLLVAVAGEQVDPLARVAPPATLLQRHDRRVSGRLVGERVLAHELALLGRARRRHRLEVEPAGRVREHVGEGERGVREQEDVRRSRAPVERAPGVRHAVSGTPGVPGRGLVVAVQDFHRIVDASRRSGRGARFRIRASVEEGGGAFACRDREA